MKFGVSTQGHPKQASVATRRDDSPSIPEAVDVRVAKVREFVPSK
jgi:hypothetical protein